jgi:hypothetical protein
MAARQIIVPGAMPSRDANGRTLPGRLRFYLPDTDTPATVFADSGLTVPHAFPILSDSAGRWPQIWAEEAAYLDVAWSDLAHDALIASFSDIRPVQDAVLGAVALVDEAAAATAADAAIALAAAADADAALAATEAFVAPFADMADAVTAAQTARDIAVAAADSAAASALAAAESAASIDTAAIFNAIDDAEARSRATAIRMAASL